MANKFELTNVGITNLSNKALKADLQSIAGAILSASKCTWDIAYHLDRILTMESFKDDFETAEKLYDFMGMKKANATQYIKAFRFMKSQKQVPFFKNGNPDTSKIKGSVALAYLLYGLKEKGELDEFEKWFAKYSDNISVYDVSVAYLKKAIDEFHNPETADSKKDSKKDSKNKK